MPTRQIDLTDDAVKLCVRWGDFSTIAGNALTNQQRLKLALRATVRASRVSPKQIGMFEGAIWYVDEAQGFEEACLPVTGPNVAALLATGFDWLPRAAEVRDQYHVSAETVSRIRAVIERLHQEHWQSLQELLRLRGEERSKLLNRLDQESLQESPSDAVEWRDEIA